MDKIQRYAHIEDGIVINISLWDGESPYNPGCEEFLPVGKNVGIGWERNGDTFIPPQPYPSWTLDEDANWQPPVPYPSDDNPYVWNEEEQRWDPVEVDA